ncbi:MAG: SpoIIE family protein phosphatase, partial [Acidobacteriota bacterium]|nr:SpoIIE family protein phosphatase [Acidobacteriota bacterium]
TYLFVGLTPIVLLVLLGLLAAFGASSQAMVRLVAAQIKNTEKETTENARSLAEAFARLPTNASDKTIQAWLNEQGAVLQASLPGASVALWRTAAGEKNNAPEWAKQAQFVFAPSTEDTRGVGPNAGSIDAPLPEWLSGRVVWSGLAYIPPPAESKEAFGTPSVRALNRTNVNGRGIALLLSVPVSRGLIERFRESTGVRVRPFFIGVEFNNDEGDNPNVVVANQPDASPKGFGTQEGRIIDGKDGQKKEVNFFADQFGEPFKGTFFVSQPWPVFLPSTNWLTGKHAPHWAFMVDWSWTAAGKQLLGDTTLGERWQQAFFGVAIAFLLLELLALFSAAWMTRAVTGTVHKLYQATEFIKRGDFSHRVRVRSRDQLGELAHAFNDMSANIESLLQERVAHERLEREVEIAAEVQSQLFPRRVPVLATVEVAGECRAARGVAGDYYDYIEVAPGLVAFALGDVSGKGISASLVMSNLQAALRAQTAIIAERLRNSHARASAAAASSIAGAEENQTLPCGVAELDDNCAISNMVERINEQLCLSTESNRFATLFLALYDDRARTLRYANAGHNAPMLLRADGSVERLTAGGTMVGAFDWMNFEEAQTTLAAGEVLLIFSDGISEAQNNLGEEYGENRLAQLALANRDAAAEEMRQAVFNEIDNWSGAQERGDDQTLVIMKGINGA